tara:strand:- start:1600 stop:1884 length:285 start_codon:yes stop_codon:yes gene_type:complete
MTSQTATLTTERASTYLQQLCKHFAHKVEVEFTPTEGTITLPFGACTLYATETALTLTVTGEPEHLARMEQVIGDHLTRFGFRESFTLDWQAAA